MWAYTGRTKPGLRVNPEYSSNGVKNGSKEEPIHRNEEVVKLRREIARNSDRRHTLGISHDVHARKQDRFKVSDELQTLSKYRLEIKTPTR